MNLGLLNVTTNSDGFYMKNFTVSIWLNGKTNFILEIDFDDGIIEYYYPQINGKFFFILKFKSKVKQFFTKIY